MIKAKAGMTNFNFIITISND